MLPVMLQLYNVRAELVKDFEGTLKEVAHIGYKYVELAMAKYFGKTAAQLRMTLDNAGLGAVSAHVPYPELIEDPENVINFYIDAGCKYIVIPFLDKDDRSTGPNYEEVKNNIARLGEVVNKKGAALLYHNHEFEFAPYKGKYALDDLYESIPAELLQTEIDVCWVKVSGVDPVDYILKYSGRSPVIHLKDFNSVSAGMDKPGYDFMAEVDKARSAGAFPFRALGHGSQDIPGIIAASEKAGAKWLVVEQDFPTPGKTAMECAKDSLAYLYSLK